MAEHCTQCSGTGKIPGTGLACLHCAGTGIEPEETKPEVKKFGPFHAYPGFKKHLAITVGLVILLIVINVIS